MRRVIGVFLGETARRIGTLRHDASGNRESASFEYDAAWLAAGDRFTIDPSLRLVAGPQFHPRGRGGSVFHAAIGEQFEPAFEHPERAAARRAAG